MSITYKLRPLLRNKKNYNNIYINFYLLKRTNLLLKNNTARLIYIIQWNNIMIVLPLYLENLTLVIKYIKIFSRDLLVIIKLIGNK
jgi:hypothetical protein